MESQLRFSPHHFKIIFIPKIPSKEKVDKESGCGYQLTVMVKKSLDEK